MDSRTLVLAVVGVAAIVIIAIVVVYQFAEQQYAQYIVGENLKNLQIQTETERENVERSKIIRETNSEELPVYQKCYDDWVTNSNATGEDFVNFAKMSYEERIKLIGCEHLIK